MMVEVLHPELSSDVPAQLRTLAQEIEEGKHPDCRAVVAIMVREGEFVPVNVWAWGRISTLETIGACAKASTRLSMNDLEC